MEKDQTLFNEYMDSIDPEMSQEYLRWLEQSVRTERLKIIQAVDLLKQRLDILRVDRREVEEALKESKLTTELVLLQQKRETVSSQTKLVLALLSILRLPRAEEGVLPPIAGQTDVDDEEAEDCSCLVGRYG